MSKVLNALPVILLTLITLPISAQSEFYVAETSKDTGDGSLRNPLNSIPAALEKARTEKETWSFISGKGNIFLTNRSYSPRRMETTAGNSP